MKIGSSRWFVADNALLAGYMGVFVKIILQPNNEWLLVYSCGDGHKEEIRQHCKTLEDAFTVIEKDTDKFNNWKNLEKAYHVNIKII